MNSQLFQLQKWPTSYLTHKKSALTTWKASLAQTTNTSPKPRLAASKIDILNTEQLIVQYGEIIARFTNGKFKIIDSTYFHKNFNDPLVDKDEKDIY